MTDTVAPRELVCLVAHERIVAHGTERQTWLVQLDREWLSVPKYPGAQLESLQPGSGMVWQSQASLQLPRGNWVQRVRQRPRPVHHQDPLTYLNKETLSHGQHTARDYFRVGRRGALVAQVSGPLDPNDDGRF